MSSVDDLAHAVWVFEARRRPYKSVAVYSDAARHYANNREQWRHITTLNPAAWIEYLLKHPDDRDREIEKLLWIKR